MCSIVTLKMECEDEYLVKNRMYNVAAEYSWGEAINCMRAKIYAFVAKTSNAVVA